MIHVVYIFLFRKLHKNGNRDEKWTKKNFRILFRIRTFSHRQNSDLQAELTRNASRHNFFSSIFNRHFPMSIQSKKQTWKLFCKFIRLLRRTSRKVEETIELLIFFFEARCRLKWIHPTNRDFHPTANGNSIKRILIVVKFTILFLSFFSLLNLKYEAGRCWARTKDESEHSDRPWVVIPELEN